MGFSFSKHTVDVEIEGKPYSINLGDADMLDKVERWGNKLQGADYSKMTEGRVAALTSDVRNYLMSLLGKEQFDEVFQGRKFDFIDGLELFAYLYAAIEGSRTDVDFRKNLAKYMPDVNWDTVEGS